MAGPSKIEWTDATWNPVRGCTRLSPGCGGPGKQGGCYAEKIAARFSDPGMTFHGFAERRNGEARWTGKLALIEDQLTVPMHWKKPRRIFVNSMSDLFHENLPDEAIDRVFAVMALCPQHTFQVLTKRAARMREWANERWQPAPAQTVKVGNEVYSKPTEKVGADRRHQIALACDDIMAGDLGEQDRFWNADGSSKHSRVGWPLPNVWLGVSCEDQERADERIPQLLETPAAVRFISAEPLLGPISLGALRLATASPYDSLRGRRAEPENDDISCAKLDWVIVGGESGPNARPMHPDWPRALRDQCSAAGVPFFFKQWGAWVPHYPKAGGDLGEDVRRGRVRIVHPTGQTDVEVSIETGGRSTIPGSRYMRAVGKKEAGRLLVGVEHNEFPKMNSTAEAA
jgi:protein gp37